MSDYQAECIAKMPPQLGELYYELHSELTWLYAKWIDFRQLFGSERETITLLNKAAPAFFGGQQSRMWEDSVLHLCRLTDRETPGGATLTVIGLSRFVPEVTVSRNVRRAAARSRTKADFAWDWRNRRIAHRERKHKSAKPLKTGSVDKMEDALKELAITLNFVAQHYLGSPMSYEATIVALGGVDNLLGCLRLGVEAFESGR